MGRNKYRCIVCGRIFPEGQGVVIKHGELTLFFHKSKCACKFFKYLLENTPYSEIGRYVKNTLDFFEEKLEKMKEIRTKKI
uniref:Uncharacterized protein n=1 Tax=Staphylothermus marinus TaxID=2280 RepID=A0A7C4NN49_STAMA